MCCWRQVEQTPCPQGSLSNCLGSKQMGQSGVARSTTCEVETFSVASMASRAGKLVPATTLSVNEACADSTAMGSIEPPACDGSPPLGSSCRTPSTAKSSEVPICPYPTAPSHSIGAPSWRVRELLLGLDRGGINELSEVLDGSILGMVTPGGRNWLKPKVSSWSPRKSCCTRSITAGVPMRFNLNSFKSFWKELYPEGLRRCSVSLM
mmetsp:Transcript_31573/g.92966  ORF Transcript_31573/g.92966 Transcript_31573/m.92966 type:complete len:208 (+) Transcript_31573:1662-2285(+)